MIGTTAALIAIAATSATTQAIAAKKQANAAKDAAAMQQAGVDRAVDMQQHVYDYKRDMYKPYADMGTSSTTMLGQLMKPTGAPGGYQLQSFGPPGYRAPDPGWAPPVQFGAGPGGPAGNNGQLQPPQVSGPPQTPAGFQPSVLPGVAPQQGQIVGQQQFQPLVSANSNMRQIWGL